ncbi:MAG TPA: hypothetical protein VKU38_05725 [Ktedonobacteraceae bacterium]|nr:hypothetical protein [Ktedonobacteraceae bacterium]
MSKLTRYIEDLLLPIITVAVLLVSLADFFGLFSLVPASRIPMLTLLLMSLALSSLVLIQRRIAEIHERVQRLLLQVALEKMAEDMLEQIDPGLIKVLKKEYFLDVVAFFQDAIAERKVQVNDILRLRHYYNRTLQCYPGATFLSTLSSGAIAFWEEATIVKATTNFIGNGGKMKHIILLKDMQELSTPAIQTVAAHLSQIGVEVHFVNAGALTGDLRKNFLVESQGKIAWDIHVHGGHVVSGTLTTSVHLNDCYCRIFEKLHENEIHN